MGPTPIVSTSKVAWGPRPARFLLCVLLVGGATSWLLRSGAAPAPLQPALRDRARQPTAVGAVGALGAVGGPGLASVSAEGTAVRRMALPPETVEPFAKVARVLVQGRVVHRGLALAGWELTFHPAGPDPRPETDWDITDDDGHFEVMLPVASYTVRSSDCVTWVAELLVPPGERGLTIDFHLPPAAVDSPD